jgi:DNA-binding XRE family transcriptional regulator
MNDISEVIENPEETEDALAGKGYWYIPRCEELRIGKKYTQEKLAVKADISRGSIGKIEKNKGVTRLIATSVYDALVSIGHEINQDEEMFCLKLKNNPYSHKYIKKMKKKKDSRVA